MAVHQEQVEEPVQVEIDERHAPPEPARVAADAGGERPVVAQAGARVGVERRGVAGEVGLEDVDAAVAIVVADGDAHARLRPAVLAVGAAGLEPDVGQRAVAVVAIERARARVVGDVEIDPAVVVEVEGADAEAVGAAGRRDPRGDGHVGERPAADVAIEHVLRAGQARAARTRRPGPCSGTGPTRGPARWPRRSRCSWRRRDRAGRRGRSRGRRSPCPSAAAPSRAPPPASHPRRSRRRDCASTGCGPRT